MMDEAISVLIQCGIDLGIPFDKIPVDKFELGYLQCCLQWVIFFVTVFCGSMNNLVKSSMGAIR